MKAAIITVAGISSRFNDGIPEGEKQLKAIYSESDPKETLLYHLLSKCSFAERIVVVGGYKFEDLTAYVEALESELKDKVKLVYNEHYEDLGSGYSFYLGLAEAFKEDPEEILFVEGDLDIDDPSFEKIVRSSKSVVTYNSDPIYANKAVVVYGNGEGKLRYAFNSAHGLLSIDEPFSFILNSGQAWKFTEPDKLKKANDWFFENEKDGTNLRIIQTYLDMDVPYEIIGLSRWTNCNTRADHKKIVSYWRNEK